VQAVLQSAHFPTICLILCTSVVFGISWGYPAGIVPPFPRSWKQQICEPTVFSCAPQDVFDLETLVLITSLRGNARLLTAVFYVATLILCCDFARSADASCHVSFILFERVVFLS